MGPIVEKKPCGDEAERVATLIRLPKAPPAVFAECTPLAKKKPRLHRRGKVGLGSLRRKQQRLFIG